MADKKKKSMGFRQYANYKAMEHMKAIEGKPVDLFPVGRVAPGPSREVSKEETTAFLTLLEQMGKAMPKPEPLYSEFTFEACPITSNN